MVENYTLAKISDLAQLKDEDIDAFCAELPHMICTLKGFYQVCEAAGETDLFEGLIPSIQWRNDGQNSIDMRFMTHTEKA